MTSAFDDLSESAIFDKRDALADEYIPSEIVARDEKKEEYMNALLPVYKGESPDNIFLYGQNGVGKTAVTHRVLNQLEASEKLQTELAVLPINCEGVNTSYRPCLDAKFRELQSFWRHLKANDPNSVEIFRSVRSLHSSDKADL